MISLCYWWGQIYHQNIQGLRRKSSELLNFLYPNLPHALCFTEHHFNQHEIELVQVDNYTLGASFCRNSFKMGGVCIFVNKNLNFIKVDLRKFSLDQDIEVCVLNYLILHIIFAYYPFIDHLLVILSISLIN